MKSWRRSSIAALAAGLALAGGHPAPAAGRVEVRYVEPERFTDVRDRAFGTAAGRDAYLDELRRYLEERGARHLLDGASLVVTITDVDMAGDFEPWRGPQFDRVRIVKDVYPPRIALQFTLTGPDGAVRAEGRRELRELAVTTSAGYHHDDPLRHEKALLDRWLQREFAPRE